MDVTFNCPHCNQTLEVDESAMGSQIECPSCNGSLTIPVIPSSRAATAAPAPSAVATAAAAAAASAQQEASKGGARHFAVPVRDTPVESLIQKPKPPLEAAAKAAAERQLRVKCIRRTECMEVGHDHFDEIVSQFLGKVGESNIVSITTLSYSHLDIGSQKLLTDYGVMVVYKG